MLRTFHLAAAVVRAGGALVATLAGSCALAGSLKVSIIDLDGHPLANAVVYVMPPAGMSSPVPSPAPSAAPEAVIDQVNKAFLPLVTVVRTGTQIRFPNSDNIRHSIYSFSPAKTFTSKLYAGKEASPVIFDHPGLVVLGCNIHDQMVAWVVIVDTSFFGKTTADGTVEIKKLPAGQYRVHTWYPGPAFEPREDAVSITDERAELRVALDASQSTLPALEGDSGAAH